MSQPSAFKASGHHWRLFVGDCAIENNLLATVARAGAQRAFVICSPSITSKTGIVTRIQAALGARCAGVFDRVENDSTYGSVCAARDAASAADADLLIAVGGGSVIVAVRAIAIFLGESGQPFELMTQYPAGEKPFSPRLLEDKIPIINIPTTPTSAMNRAGTGLKNPELDQRMEYFDPQTRPQAIFLDDGALLETPKSVLRSTATTVFASLLSGIAHSPSNPLVAADLGQAVELGRTAYTQLANDVDDVITRRNLCLAAFLQNRAEDDGRALIHGGAFAGDYAVATALHIRYPWIGQGEATSVLHAPALRIAEQVEPQAAERVAKVLSVWQHGEDIETARERIAVELERLYAGNNMPPNLRSLEVPKEEFQQIAAQTLKNFNARAIRGSSEERINFTTRLLQAAW